MSTIHRQSTDNNELALAYRFIEQTDTNVFLTGKAGTGKTTFLRELRKKSPKRMIVVAPTGVAAINAGGVTIHSFFQLPLSPYIPGMSFSNDGRKQYSFSKEKKNILRSLDLLVIDEISMVRADLLDAIDAVLRRYKDHTRPFGGVQLLMIGDLQQLSPVVKESEAQLLAPHYPTFYFFGSHALKESNYITIELKTIYRQSDPHFVSILNAIRERQIDRALLARLNERHIPNFADKEHEGYIRLTTHNHTAQRYNEQRLDALSSRQHDYKAEVKGNFNEALFPAEATLRLKEGAQVMFIRNDDSPQHRYYNGKIGHIQSLAADQIVVRCDDGNSFCIEPCEWTNSRYILDENTKEIREEVEGTFRQYPLRLAWAITIHKSQGLTFDKAVIDAASSFAHGQVYVALSRCKTLQGLVLASPVTASAIISDDTVNSFVKSGVIQTTEASKQLEDLQQAYSRKLLDELFDFTPLQKALGYISRIMEEHFYRLYPLLVEQYRTASAAFREKVTDVAERFRAQYTNLLRMEGMPADNDLLQERIHKAANYFSRTLDETLLSLLTETHVDTDNKSIRKRFDDTFYNLREEFYVKHSLMRRFVEESFCTTAYLRHKATATLEGSDMLFNPPTPKSNGRKRRPASVVQSIPTDIRYPILYQSLSAWRRDKCSELGLPAYIILKQKALLCMVNSLPSNMEELIDIPYFGKQSAEKYGEEILDVIQKFVSKYGKE